MHQFIITYLPCINALYSLNKNYYLLTILFIMQTIFGVDYFKTLNKISGYIYCMYIILTVPYFILISTYTPFSDYYIKYIYLCLFLYVLSSLIQIINYNYSRRLYILVHYIGNISTLVMLISLPKIHIEYYIDSPNMVKVIHI